MKNILGRLTAEMDFFSSKADGICKCCKRKIEGKTLNRLYCKICEPYIKKLINKYNHRVSRNRKQLRDYKAIGSLGRIKQRIQLYNDSKRKIKNLRNKARYYEQKSNDTKKE